MNEERGQVFPPSEVRLHVQHPIIDTHDHARSVVTHLNNNTRRRRRGDRRERADDDSG